MKSGLILTRKWRSESVHLSSFAGVSPTRARSQIWFAAVLGDAEGELGLAAEVALDDLFGLGI
jgi:hypothetical protein